VRAGRYVAGRWHTSILRRQRERDLAATVRRANNASFNRAEALVAAELERRGATPDRDAAGHVRGATGPGGYKKVEVALVGPDKRGLFRDDKPRADVDIVIFTDCAGHFWLATAAEVREAW
jgi:hypothetical protein